MYGMTVRGEKSPARISNDRKGVKEQIWDIVSIIENCRIGSGLKW